MVSLEERSRLSRALNDIDIRIHSNLASDEILQLALDGFVEALAADAGDIKLREGDRWVVRYQQGFTPDVVGLQLGLEEAPVAEKVAAKRAPVRVSDYLAQDRIPYIGFPLIQGLRSVMAVPLISRGDVTGCLFAWMRDQPREFSEEALDFAQRMASSVALALENSRLFEAEQRARIRAEKAELHLQQELEVTKSLLKASDEFSTETEPDKLLDCLAHVAMETTGITRAFVNLIDMQEQVLIPKVATAGLSVPRGESIPFSQLTTTSRKAIGEKRTAILDYERPGIPSYDRDIALANEARMVLFVPLIHQSDVIGHIALDEPAQRHEFTAKQVRVVESIAAQATVALQNARQFEREHRIAETFQQALLEPPGHIDGISMSCLYQAASSAARVGGDFYDAFSLDADLVALVVGDVAGKGIGVAPLTALLRDGARAYLLEDSDPAACFARLNTLAYRFTPTDKFATAFVGVLNRSTRELLYCSAAHPHAVVQSDGGARVLGCTPAPLLGAFADADYETQRTVLDPGEVLVMVTDGVTEARQGDALFGEDGLRDAVARLSGTPVEELPDALLDAVVEFSGGQLRDDIVVLCVSMSP